MNFSQVLQVFDTLDGLLLWVVSTGAQLFGCWLFGIINARLLENWVAWHNFPMWIKKAVPLALAGIFAFGAQVLLAAEITQYIPEALVIVILAGVNYLVGQREYEAIKDSNYAVATRLKAGIKGE